VLSDRFGLGSFSFGFAGRCFKAMASDEENWIPVPENPDSNIVITIPVTEERTGNGSSWAEIVEAERPGVSHNHPARAVYPSHLRSVVNSFDGTMPVYIL